MHSAPVVRDNLLRMTKYRPGLFVQYTDTPPGSPHTFQEIVTREDYEAYVTEKESRPERHEADRVYLRFGGGDISFFDTGDHFPYGPPKVFTREEACDYLDRCIWEANKKRDSLAP